MKKILLLLFCLILFPICINSLYSQTNQDSEDPRFIIHTVDLKQQNLRFYWKSNDGVNIGNHEKLKKYLENKSQKLIFATNGGMYMKDGSPQGLFIENGIVKIPLDTLKKDYGNFYLEPNGVFYVTKDNKGVVCKTENFKLSKNIVYATQSGPMLVIDNKIHPVFKKDSKHLHIRNGIGILSNGDLLFAMSKGLITLYDFAEFFKNNGCKNALYFDGFVSRTYLPSKNWKQLDGNFGVIIAEIEEMN
ncbi:phosphodiester glycosidase family protein [Flavivirga aquimarina]|uniref:Phosphodiester glycosidase family protein n=1 Tax=Flavivirga aquimarina TaxID=2027862 RepID=A0ABT8W8A5_9FLAO|nr:phosphodiester glycosidase family protein [Flavivirga aquimarina]MDO5969351.1 phosphodiester glycosidase family protein [Flavivirga aquimarina]